MTDSKHSTAALPKQSPQIKLNLIDTKAVAEPVVTIEMTKRDLKNLELLVARNEALKKRCRDRAAMKRGEQWQPARICKKPIEWKILPSPNS
jgi:hypothetical protein